MSVVSNELTLQQTKGHLERLAPQIRIAVEPCVVLKPKDKGVSELIQMESASAEVVFLGLATPKPGEEAEYAERLERLAGGLPTVFFVKNASPFVGELLESLEVAE